MRFILTKKKKVETTSYSINKMSYASLILNKLNEIICSQYFGGNKNTNNKLWLCYATLMLMQLTIQLEWGKTY